MSASTENIMKSIVVNKLVINIGTGSDKQQHENARRLIELVSSGRKPADEISKKRNPSFKISKGQKIGAFVTIRGNQATKLIPRLFDANGNKLKDTSITNNSVCFGIHEYIDINGIKYDPKIGMMGMNVSISFKRKGLRVALRKRRRAQIAQHHRSIQRDELTDYLKQKFNVSIQNG